MILGNSKFLRKNHIVRDIGLDFVRPDDDFNYKEISQLETTDSKQRHQRRDARDFAVYAF